MLQPGVIPTAEPVLNVGIVLPEDEYTSIEIEIPEDSRYRLKYSDVNYLLTAGNMLSFAITKKGMSFKHGHRNEVASNVVRIDSPGGSHSLAPQSGLKIRKVISGRDFHWKKYIDVTLPGNVLLKRHENTLLVTNELPIEQYLACVATSEMGAACPPALIEAQTIAARSWMLANVEQKHIRLGMDVCNDDCCQRYQGTTFLTDQSLKGAMNTYGQVLIHGNAICDARYSKSCGGVMESFDTIWGGPPVDYLQVKADSMNEPPEWQKPLSDEQNFEKWINSSPETFCSPAIIPEQDLKKYLGNVDEQGHYFRWRTIIPQAEMTENVNRHRGINASAIKKVEIKRRGGSGRTNSLTVYYIDQKKELRSIDVKDEFGIRQTMHPKFLFSSAFAAQGTDMDGDGIPANFVLQGAGWGHGVGLCQIGALGMSLKGFPAEEILSHYFPGSQLKKIY
jgi:peptidoglycan hydrolase-like amidase